MIGIPSDIGGPAFVAFHQYADGVRAERHGGGVKLRLAQNQPVRLFHIRNNVVFRGFAAARQTRKRQRSGHQLQEIAAIDGIIPFRSLTRKFAMEQLFKLRVFRELFQRPPILFAGFVRQLRAHRRQIQRLVLKRCCPRSRIS